MFYVQLEDLLRLKIYHDFHEYLIFNLPTNWPETAVKLLSSTPKLIGIKKCVKLQANQETVPRVSHTDSE